jgi:hypothetical protein
VFAAFQLFEYNLDAQSQAGPGFHWARELPQRGAATFGGVWMSLFDWLLVGHLVGDFLLQSDRMARHKGSDWSRMLSHIGLYLVAMAAVVGIYALSHQIPVWVVLVALLFIGGTHIILDRREFTAWWMRIVGISAEGSWLPIVVDQVFHILVLVAVTQIMLWNGG